MSRQKVLEKNKQERHIRGGLATKEKYEHIRGKIFPGRNCPGMIWQIKA